jgi:excisionase family DNA binding protein
MAEPAETFELGEGWATVRQAAEQLNLSPRSVLRLCDSGRLTFRRTEGGHIRIPAEAVKAYVRGGLIQDRRLPEASTPLQVKREAIEAKKIELQELELNDLLEEKRREKADRDAEKQREEEERQERIRAEQREAEREENASRKAQEREEQIAFWIADACAELPEDLPAEYIPPIHQAIRDALAVVTFYERPDIIQRIAWSARDRMLGPWQRYKEARAHAAWLKKQQDDAWRDLVLSWPSSFPRDDEAVRAALDQAATSAMQSLGPDSSWAEQADARRKAVERVVAPYRRVAQAIRVLRPHLQRRHTEGFLPAQFSSQDLDLLARLTEPKLRRYLEAEGRKRELTDEEAEQLARDFIDIQNKLI